METLRKVLNHEEDGEGYSIIGENVSGQGSYYCGGMCTLSWKERLIGFAVCVAVGIACSILGVVFCFFGNYTGFAIWYTLGSCTSLASTLFLRGPLAQLKSMFKGTRIIATCVLIVSLILTLMAALWWKNGMLALIFCLIQFCAFAWYSLSFIPFARDAVKKTCATCLA